MRHYPSNRKPRNSDCGIQGNSTDSGRQQVMPGEKNDCTVRALAEAFEIPYLEAYGMLLVNGRKFKHRFNFIRFMRETYPHIQEMPKPHMTVANYINTIAHSGNWMILIRGHVFTVKDKVIIDINPLSNLNRHVLIAWRIK